MPHPTLVRRCLSLAALALAPAALPPAGATAQPAPVTDGIVVVWRDAAARPQRLDARADAGASLVRTLGDPRFQLLRADPGRPVGAALAALRADPAVLVASRDGWDVPLATTDDPLFDQQWALRNSGLGVGGYLGAAVPGADVGALAAWDRTRGSWRTVVADVDTGYRFDAPDLASVAWTNRDELPNGLDDDRNGIVDDLQGADFAASSYAPEPDGDPTDDDYVGGGHGLHTAGIIAAAGNDGVGISGVAQDVRVMPLKVCRRDDAVRDGSICPRSAQIAAINYAGAKRARAANLSIGSSGAGDPAVLAALAANPGTLFVTAAGNDAQDNDAVAHWPCNYDPATTGIAGAVDNVICVAATDQGDRLASFSDWGAGHVDLGAPGTEILSAYPAVEALVSDDFEAYELSGHWYATDWALAPAGDGPLTSHGLTDSPGRAPTAGSLTSARMSLTVPIGWDACVVSGRRFVRAGEGGEVTWEVTADGAPAQERFPQVLADTSGGAMERFEAGPIVPSMAHAVGLGFDYRAGPSPRAEDGVWIDDVEYRCRAGLGMPTGRAFLDGTSLAAAHVTGAAALLFSLRPSATVAEVKAALLAGVDRVPALAGRTVSGGRLDAARALDEIVQPDTAIARRPPAVTGARSATFAFARADAAIGASFACRLDGGPFAPCTSPARYRGLRGGRHTFAARASSPQGVMTDPTPATASWRVTQCVVPRLRGRSLAAARRALRRARCSVGRARIPRGVRRPMVKSSSPKAGSVRIDGAPVRLMLGPAARSRRHGRRR